MALSAALSPLFTLRGLLLCGGVVRMCLLLWGEWQDRHLAVPYTDIDYGVFSDGALLVARGASPFDRSTYRYSPLMSDITHSNDAPPSRATHAPL